MSHTLPKRTAMEPKKAKILGTFVKPGGSSAGCCRYLPLGLAILMVGTWSAPASAQEPNSNAAGSVLETLLDSLFGIPPAASSSHDDPFGGPLVPPSTGGEMAMPDEAVMDQAPVGPPKRIEVMDDFDAAVQTSLLEQRPLLVIGGADWCTWCRKLEQELAAPAAEQILTRWTIVKIDVDQSPELAAEFEVTALPALRVVSAERRVIAKAEGYMSLDKLEAWLEKVGVQVDPALARVLYGTATPDAEQLAQLIDFMGNRSPALRQSALNRLVAAPTAAGPSVIGALRQGSLSQQLCALEILRSWGAPVDGLDPWQPETLHIQRFDQLDQWYQTYRASAFQSEVPLDTSTVAPEKIKEAVTRWLLEPDTKRRLWLSELLKYGRAIEPEVRARLASSDVLNDQQRSWLRQLLYMSLAGEKTRALHADLLTALASLNADTHRKAAARLLELANASDQALVDELSQDIDTLVRELTVPALQRLGALQQSQRLQNLLADKSPSVRTAVLREMAENPEPDSLKLLSQYVTTETDEDLLVYTTKTLGELHGQEGAEETLCQLLKNDSWRVRAAAIDAFSSLSEHRYDLTQNVVSADVFDAILVATEDADPFVVQRASELLPKLISTRNVKSVARFLTKRPESIEKFWESISEHQQGQIRKSLTSSALQLLSSEDSVEVRGAIELLAHVHPDTLKTQLPNLLQANDVSVRIAALKGTLALWNATRSDALTKLTAAAHADKSSDDSSVFQPWYPVPESFMSLPERQVEADLVVEPESNETPSAASVPEAALPVPAELAAIDDFFGGPAPVATPTTPDTHETSPADDPAADPAAEAATTSPAAAILQLALPDDLFGGPALKADRSSIAGPTDVDPPTAVRSDDLVGTAGQAAPQRNRVEALSDWLAIWQAEHASASGPASTQAVREQLQTLLSDFTASELNMDQQNYTPAQAEKAWIALVNLASGRGELAPALATSPLMKPVDSPISKATVAPPVAAQIFPWLPADQLWPIVQSHKLDWQRDLTDDEQTFLKSITHYENHQVAQWMLDGIGQSSLTDAQWIVAANLLTRALRGENDQAEQMYIESSALAGEPPFQSYGSPIVGRAATMKWLMEQHARELSTDQRALLLLQLYRFDYRLGSLSAVGRVAAAKAWDREVQLATLIALSTSPRVTADRAIQWLDHPLQEVRDLSLKRLTSDNSAFYAVSVPLGVTTVYENRDIPLFFFAARPLPVELLKQRLQVTANDWPAFLLLLASRSVELDEWPAELSTEQIVFATAALASAKRTDQAAIKIYSRAASEVEYYQRETVSYLLGNLQTPEVKAIRKRLRSSGYSYPSPF